MFQAIWALLTNGIFWSGILAGAIAFLIIAIKQGWIKIEKK